MAQNSLFNPRSDMEQRRHNTIVVVGIVLLIAFNIITAIFNRLKAPDAGQAEPPAIVEPASGSGNDEAVTGPSTGTSTASDGRTADLVRVDTVAVSDRTSLGNYLPENAAATLGESLTAWAGKQKPPIDITGAEIVLSSIADAEGKTSFTIGALAYGEPMSISCTYDAAEGKFSFKTAYEPASVSDTEKLSHHIPGDAAAKLAGELGTWAAGRKPVIDVSSAAVDLNSVSEKDGKVTFSISAEAGGEPVKVTCTYTAEEKTLSFKASFDPIPTADAARLSLHLPEDAANRLDGEITTWAAGHSPVLDTSQATLNPNSVSEKDGKVTFIVNAKVGGDAMKISCTYVVAEKDLTFKAVFDPVEATDVARLQRHLDDGVAQNIGGELGNWAAAQQPAVNVEGATIDPATISAKDGVTTCTIVCGTDKAPVKVRCSIDAANGSYSFSIVYDPVKASDAAALARFLPEAAAKALGGELSTWCAAQNPKLDAGNAQVDPNTIVEKDGNVTFTVTIGNAKVTCTYSAADGHYTFAKA